MKLFIIIAGCLVCITGCTTTTNEPEKDNQQTASSTSVISSSSSSVRADTIDLASTFYKRAQMLHANEKHQSAISFYMTAAELGSSEALQEANSLIQNHEGYADFEQNWMTWIQQASQKGHMLAQITLARKYLSGIGVQRDIVKGYAWYLVVEQSNEQKPEWIERQWRGTRNVLTQDQIRQAEKMSSVWIDKIPPSTVSLDSITYLYTEASGLPFVLKYADTMPSIHTLVIHGEEVTSIPQSIEKLQGLLQLIIHETKISSLPASIGTISSLQTLRILNTPIKSLPAEIGQIESLQTLNIFHTELEELPQTLSSMTNLSMLNVTRSKLQKIPSDLSKLIYISQVNLTSNLLKEIPTGLISMPAIEKIIIKNNLITSIPREVLEKPSLTLIDVSGNPINVQSFNNQVVPNTLTVKGIPSGNTGEETPNEDPITDIPDIPLPVPPLQSDIVSLYFYTQSEVSNAISTPSIVVKRPLSDTSTAPDVAIKLLLAGPTSSEEELGARTTVDLLSLADEYKGTTVQNGVAQVDFKRSALPALNSSAARQLMIKAAIEKTLLSIAGITEVQYSFNGTVFTEWDA